MPSVSSVLAVLLLAGSTVLAGPIVGRQDVIQCTYNDGVQIIDFDQAQAARWLEGDETPPMTLVPDAFQQAMQDCCDKSPSSRVASAKAPTTEKADVDAEPKQTNRIGAPTRAGASKPSKENEKAVANAKKPFTDPSVSDKSSGDARVGKQSSTGTDAVVGVPQQASASDPEANVAGLTNPVTGPNEQDSTTLSLVDPNPASTNEGNEKAGINVAGLSNPTAQGSAKPAGTNEGKEKANAKVPAAGGPQKHAGATKLPTEDEKADADAKKSSTDEAVSDKSSDPASTGANSLNGLNLDKPTSDAVDAAVADSSNPLDDPTNEQGSADAGTNQHGGDEKAAAKVSEPATPKPAAPEPANDRIGTGSHKSSKESVQKPVPATEKADISEQQPSEPASAPTEQTSEQAAAGSPLPLGLGGNGVKEGVMDNGKCTCRV